AALTQLNVAQSMIVVLFGATMAMLALAGGLAFGLGSVETARGLVSGWAAGRVLQPGQRVRIGQHAGTIIRHDLNSTVVDTDDGQIFIPNAELTHQHVMLLDGDGFSNGFQAPQPPSAATSPRQDSDSLVPDRP
ncbi:MAG TPA: mechanosensitive ion channel domain-containing protein, partial [Ktedonobacterales bacterium]|nr:mechanosensitive ion channel domain-containing protein [Ktedonobacterales bacterium]